MRLIILLAVLAAFLAVDLLPLFMDQQ